MRWAPEAAEAAGTFLLVFVGCGAILVDSLTGQLGHLGVSLAFGLVVAAMVYATGHLSGAHFNPAVTLAFAATGHFPWRRVPAYVATQCLAALAAAATLRWLLGDVAQLGSTQVSTLVTPTGAFALEAALTFALMFTICSVATDGRASAPLAGVAIGAAVAMGSLFGGPLTGASMNPARSFGPALAAGVPLDLLAHVLAPLVGALAAATLYGLVRRGSRPLAAPRPLRAGAGKPSAEEDPA